MHIIEKLNIDLDFTTAKIDNNRLNSLQEVLQKSSQKYQVEKWDDENFWPAKNTGDEIISQFFTLGNSINFKYWDKNSSGLQYCEGKKGGIHCRGAMYMWRSLKICLEKNIFDILDARQLSKIELDDVKKIFQDDNENDVLPALQERLFNWKNLGENLIQDWNGKSIHIINGCNNSLINFVNFFRKFRAFDDPLCKMIMVNAIMHQGRKLIKFNEPILPGMDYQLLKQLLRQGIVIPSDEITKKLQNYEILNRDEALQLRKAGLYSLITIMENSNLNGDLIDNLIWQNRKKCEDANPVCQIEGKEHECPFLDFCEKKTKILIPLEETRYY